MPPDEQVENLDSIVKHLLSKPGQDDAVKEEPDAEGEAPVEGEREAPPAKAEVQKEAPREVPGEGEEPAPVEEPVDDDGGEEPVDIDAIELEVQVDGEVRRVPISELKKRYSAEGAIDKRLQEATQGRAVIQRQAQELNQVLEHSVARLQALDGVLEQAQQPTVDMEQLRKTDPTKWLFEKERQREIQDRRERVNREMQRMQGEQERLRQAAMHEYTKAEYAALAKAYPEFADPKTKKTTTAALYETAKHYNYSQQEVDDVRDHRAILVLRDAMNWRNHVAKLAKTAEPSARKEPKPLLKPGVKKSSTQTREQREMRALRETARRTGKAEDVAATLLMRGRPTRQ